MLGNGQYTNFMVNPVMEKDGELIEPHRYQKNDGYESCGHVPAIAPEFHRIMGLHKYPNRGGACILTPWNYYIFYNDKSILEKAILR